MTPPTWQALGRTFADGTRARVMGIVNATPDSFSDGGRWLAISDAVDHAARLVDEGADLLDVGGESSRPGASVVPVEVELERVVPVVEALARRFEIPISVDTTKPEVARRSIEAGAVIVNDIHGLDDPELAEVVARAGVGVVLMHMRGTPQSMQDDPRYDDVVREVRAELAERVERAERLGIPRSRIAVDPGIGFAKTNAHSLDLLRGLEALADLGCALLVGTSRKGFIGKLTGKAVGHRAVASAASALAAIAGGARVVRVHDVGATVDAVRVWEAQRGGPIRYFGGG